MPSYARAAQRPAPAIIKGGYKNERFMKKVTAPTAGFRASSSGYDETRRISSIKLWKKRNTPVSSEYFERKHYEDFVDNYRENDDLGPIPRWDHFPHPVRVFEDINTHGNHGAGVRFRDPKTSYFMFLIAKRIQLFTESGDTQKIETEVQSAEYLRDLCNINKCMFGPRSRHGLLKCYERADRLDDVERLFQEIVKLDDGMIAKKAAVYFEILARHGKLDKASSIYKQMFRSDNPLDTAAGDALLRAACEHGTLEDCKSTYKLVNGTSSYKILADYVEKTLESREVRTQFQFMTPLDIDSFWSLLFKRANPEIIFSLWDESVLTEHQMSTSYWVRLGVSCCDDKRNSKSFVKQFCEILPLEETAATSLRILRWCNKQEAVHCSLAGLRLYAALANNGSELSLEAAHLAEAIAKRVSSNAA